MNRSIRNHTLNQRGAVLISALAFTIVISCVLAGIGALTVSLYQRATTEGDYAAALNIAEAGLNWEIRQLSQFGVPGDSATGPACTGQVDGPCTRTVWYTNAGGTTVTIPGPSSTTPATFSVYVTNDDSNFTSPWAAPNPAAIWSTGTVNGVTASVNRTLHIRSKSKSIFDEYALFGISSSNFSGNYIIDGQYGSNSPINTTGNSSVVYGNIVFNGPGQSGDTYPNPIGWVGGGRTPAFGPYGTVTHQPDAIVWPTVSQIADIAASKKSGSAIAAGAGLAWFKANNDNVRLDGTGIQVFAAGDAALTDPNASRITTAIAASALKDAQGYWNLPAHAGTADNNPMDNPSSLTPRYVFPARTWLFVNPTNSVTIPAYGLNGINNHVVILPGSGDPNVYRDYYFENIVMSGSDAVLVDTARGPIRIWLDAPDGNYSTKDDILGVFVFTTSTTSPIVTDATDPARFRMFDNKGILSGGTTKGVLALGGGNFFPGGIYDNNGTPYSQVQFSGGSVIYGSVISRSFGGNGNPLIKFPNNASNAAPVDWSLWWGFRSGWQELNGAN